MEFSLDSIKKEIESRRAENLVMEQETGTGRMGAPRDSKKFLADLLNSVNSGGAPTPAVQALRTVTEVTDQRLGVPTTVGRPSPTPVQGYNPPPQQYQPQPQIMNEGMGQDRGEAYFEQQLQRGYDMLRSRGGNQQPINPNAGLSAALNEYAASPFVGANQNGGINANALNEHITKSMGEIMGGSNFTKIVEGAYKNMINEMYTKEKIETALVDILQGETFKKIMKKLIVDTLIEIQNRNKK